MSGSGNDNLDPRWAQDPQAYLLQQNERLQLLLNLTSRVTSNLDLREVLRAISANFRELMRCDGAGVWLPGEEAGTFKLYAFDASSSKGFAKEDLIITPAENDPGKRAFETMKPTVATVEEIGWPGGGEGYRLAAAEGVKSACFIPLVSRGRALGDLMIVRKTEGTFTAADVDFLSQAAGQIAIAIENALAYREISELKDKLAQEKLYLEEEIRSEMNFAEIVGKSSALRKVLKQVETVATTDSTVLIYGETGAGKELIARAIHDLSMRKSKAFVKLNCAAIPTGLLESELFGHERGAFTGAIVQRIGRFEVAHHGTLFLDEVGDIPPELQPKLLRVLQEREFERLGSGRTLHTDARLIAVTNRDLAALVAEHKFRADLFYRLNVFPVHVPALHERPEDIPLLVRHFVEHYARRMKRAIETIPSETMEALTRYRWPGNVRELQNLIERAVILSPGPVLHVPLADLDVRATGGRPRGPAQTLEEAERAHIVATLTDTNWVVAGARGAAARLGMNRSTLQFRMKKLGIVRSKAEPTYLPQRLRRAAP